MKVFQTGHVSETFKAMFRQFPEQLQTEVVALTTMIVFVKESLSDYYLAVFLHNFFFQYIFFIIKMIDYIFSLHLFYNDYTAMKGIIFDISMFYFYYYFFIYYLFSPRSKKS